MFEFNVALRPQRPHGQYIRDGEPRAASTTLTLLLSSVVGSKLASPLVLITKVSPR